VAYGEDLHNLTILEEPIINTEDDTPWSGTIGRRDVIYCDGYYYMVYEISTDQVAGSAYGGAQWSHMFARSRDLIEWEISDGPLLTQSKTGFGYDGTCWMVVGRHLYVYMREGSSTTAVELTLAK
jgi:beta-xylosidase